MVPKTATKGAKKAVTKAKAKAVRTGDKKHRRRKRESYGIYIYKVKVLKEGSCFQIHVLSNRNSRFKIQKTLLSV